MVGFSCGEVKKSFSLYVETFTTATVFLHRSHHKETIGTVYTFHSTNEDPEVCEV